MPADQSFRAKQRGVARNMAAALVLSLGLLVASLMLGRPQPIESRMMVAAAAVAILVAWLAATIGNVARLRFFSPDAIDAGSADGGHGDEAVLQGGAILQNTLEQVVLAASVYAGLALLIDRSTLTIAACVALFCAGRMLFWAGYAGGATGRAMGFALTFYPSVAALLIVLGTITANALR